MGSGLYAASDTARQLFAAADEVLGFPLSKICFEGPQERLTATAIQQPAVLTVSVICFRLLQERLGQAAHQSFVAGAGHSLGEYSALVAAGALEFRDAVLLVHRRGQYMQEAVPANEGKMAALLGKNLSEIEQSLSQVRGGLVEIANINAPGQIVIAGQRNAVDELIAKIPGIKSVELPVSAPFHCSLMRPAAEKLAECLNTVKIRPCSFPVYANYTSQAQRSPEEVKDNLLFQVCNRVRWVECVEHAISQQRPDLAVEFGCGSVLSGMLKRINPGMRRANIDSLESAAQVAQE